MLKVFVPQEVKFFVTHIGQTKLCYVGATGEEVPILKLRGLYIGIAVSAAELILRTMS